MSSNPEHMREYMRKRRQERRIRLIAHMGGKCAVCGSIEGLEFNHKDRRTKAFGSMSGCWLDTSWEKVLAEAAKCELLCEEHHKEFTRGQYRRGEIKTWNSLLLGEMKHGTSRMYFAKCRCEPCRAARAAHRKGLCGYAEVWPRISLSGSSEAVATVC